MRYKEIQRIDELMGVKKFANMTPSEITDYVSSNFGNGEISVLGSGHHATALLIGDNVYKFWLVDSAYEFFVQYALEHQDCKFFPKFKSSIKTLPTFFARGARFPKRVKYIKMERLSPLVGKKYPSLPVYKDRTDVSIPINRIAGLIDLYGTGGSKERILDILKKTEFPDGEFSDKFIEFFTSVFELIKASRWEGFNLDWSEENVMMREDTPVIIDPITNEDDCAINDKFKDFYDKLANGKLRKTTKVVYGREKP